MANFPNFQRCQPAGIQVPLPAMSALRGILFDLDDTIVLDEAVGREAMLVTAAAARDRDGADPVRFARFATDAAERLWAVGPSHEYCRMIGISATECLWADFGGTGPDADTLREWSARFRLQVFEAALRDQLLDNPDGAGALAAIFARARRKGQRLLPDAVETLARLKKHFRIGLLTNGDSALQREKFHASGLAPLFDAVIVSGEHGIGKPAPGIFLIALDALGCTAGETWMVGNSLERDIAGARAAGLAAAVWLRVPGSEEFADVTPDFEITGLHELVDLALPPVENPR